MHLKGIEHEIVEEPFRKWTPWLRNWAEDTTERLRVPVLQYTDEEGIEHALPESHDINLFLDSLEGNPEYTPDQSSEPFNEMQEWREWCDEDFKKQIDVYKYGKEHRFVLEENQENMAVLGEKMQKLEDRLTTSEYLVENRLTLADIAIIPFIRQIMRTRDGEYDFARFPQVLTWTNGIIATDWFEQIVMKRYPFADTEE